MSQYINTCREAVASIDVEALASQPIGQEVGRGSGFMFRSIGSLVIGERKVHTGLKEPIRDKTETIMRLLNEAAFIDLITDVAPDLRLKVPAFMALVAIQGHEDPAGILTEDVSQGGAKRVWSRPASQLVREQLSETFKKFGSMEDVLMSEECDRTVAFDVAGEERLLDFTPKPIRMSGLEGASALHGERMREVYDILEELTITLPQESLLVGSLNQSNT